MYVVVRYLVKKFERNVFIKFGECFKYNRCYYLMFDGEYVIVEEFVFGFFVKYVNNNGNCVLVLEDVI